MASLNVILYRFFFFLFWLFFGKHLVSVFWLVLTDHFGAVLQAGRPPFRGGGRRGGGPHRGGGRSGHRPPRQDGGGRPFRGRGHMGRGGGRRFPPAPVTSAPPYPGPEPFLEQPPAPFPAPAAPPPSKPAKAPRRTPQVLWCEICRVECNSLEILERHNSGKRHKKTLQRYEEIQKHKKLESQSQAMVTDQAENVQGGEENKASTDVYAPKDSAPADVLTGASTDVNKTEPDLQNQIAEQSQSGMGKVVITNEPPMRKRKMDRFDNWRYPPKQNMTKFGRGGKRPRPSEPVRSPESPKDQPTRYCALCNIMCDTQAVFECHLQGKKHQSRAKRFPVPQAGYVAMGYHAPSTRQAQPADSNPKGPPEEGSGNHPAQEEVSGTQAQQDLETQGQEVNPKPPEDKDDDMMKHDGGDAVMGEHKGQDAVSETVATQDNSFATAELADSVYMPAEDAVSAPEFGVPLADNIALPGLDVKAEENDSKTEEPTSD